MTTTTGPAAGQPWEPRPFGMGQPAKPRVARASLRGYRGQPALVRQAAGNFSNAQRVLTGPDRRPQFC